MTIQQTAATEFTATKGNTTWTLWKSEYASLGWYVVADNPTTRAYGAIPKRFDDLAAVEAKYKAFAGIAALVADLPAIAA